MQRAIDRMLASSELAHGGEHRDILETYRMFAEDRGWLGRIAEAIRQRPDRRGGGAEGARRHARPHDAGHRPLSARAAGRSRRPREPAAAPSDRAAPPRPRPTPSARRCRPGRAQHGAGRAARLRPQAPAGRWCSRKARRPRMSRSSRARSTFPSSAGSRSAVAPGRAGDPVVVDGDNGPCCVRPARTSAGLAVETAAARRTRRPATRRCATLPAVTRDGVAIVAASSMPACCSTCRIWTATGAEGVGLYRTEIPLHGAARLPRRRRRRPSSIAACSSRPSGKPVVFRTLDIGGDKLLPYFARTSRGEPGDGLARDPHRARPAGACCASSCAPCCARPAAGRCRVMFPMIAEVAEFDARAPLLDMELRAPAQPRQAGAADAQGRRHARSAGAAVAAAGAAAGASISSRSARNDLVQFLFASDRGNPRLAERYDVLSPAVLTLPGQIVRAAAAAGVTLSAVRRDGRQPARGDGADRARLSQPVDVADGDRAGQGDGAEPGVSGACGNIWPPPPACPTIVCAKSCVNSPATTAFRSKYSTDAGRAGQTNGPRGAQPLPFRRSRGGCSQRRQHGSGV